MRSLSIPLLCGVFGLWGLSGCESGKPAANPPAETPQPALGSSQPDAGTDPQPNESTQPQEPAAMLTVEVQPCGESLDGEKISQYILANSQGMTVKLLDFGGILTSVEVPDRNNHKSNVTLGFSNLDGYFENKPYFGGICGRYANRISGAKFMLDDKEYTPFANTPPNHLHGGKEGFMKKVYRAETFQETDSVGVKLTRTSPDGEEGYPGALTVELVYRLNDNNELTIDYTATTDKPTVLNLTNHAYWNLAGNSAPSILDHELTLQADEYVEIDENAIPTGKVLPVAGTCMDFTTPHTLGERIAETTNGNGGYDHCYIVRGGGQAKPVLVAKVVEPTTGRMMEIFTTEPGVQLYTGNYLDGTADTSHAPKQGAFCLETQHLPDSPNRPEFPTTVLRPGETYRQTTIHKFSVAK